MCYFDGIINIMLVRRIFKIKRIFTILEES